MDIPAEGHRKRPFLVPVTVGVNTYIDVALLTAGHCTEQLFVSEKSPVIDTPGDIGHRRNYPPAHPQVLRQCQRFDSRTTARAD